MVWEVGPMSKKSFLSAVRDFAIENPDRLGDEDFYWSNIEILREKYLPYNKEAEKRENDE